MTLEDINCLPLKEEVKVVAITKAKLKSIAKVVNPVDDPVVEIVHEKRRGRPTIEIQKIYDFIKILIFYILNLKWTSQLNEINKKFFIYLLKNIFFFSRCNYFFYLFFSRL